MTILIFLLLLSFLVIIHELGHFLTALWTKVKIEEFGLGYPPKAFTLFRWRGIPFTVNWLPFGGFVRMEGEDGSVETDLRSKIQDSSSADSALSGKPRLLDLILPSQDDATPFYTKSKRARLLVLYAGVTINFLFGIFAFATIYTKMGIPTPVNVPHIVEIAENTPAQEAGLEIGDVVKSIYSTLEDGDVEQVAITNTDQFIDYVNSNLGQTLTIEVQRGEELVVVDVYARTLEEREVGQGAIGVRFDEVVLKFYPWWQMPFRGVWIGIQQSIGLSFLILQAFGDIIVKLFTQARVPEGVAGPVGIVHQASKTGIFQEGWLTLLNFAGMLSINLAILNVLPIPALDGGRALFVMLETFIGARRREKIEGKLNYIGFALLLTLIAVITLKDIWSVFVDFRG